MRLAFAVAAHLEPEILVVDEVLAVGDAQFQKKCLGKMSEVAGQGRTVLFVSHNMTAIRRLCERAVLLDQGVVVNIGQVDEVVSTYMDTIDTDSQVTEWQQPDEAPGNDKVKLKRVAVNPGPGDGLLNVHMPFNLEFEIWNQKRRPAANFSLVLTTSDNVIVFNSTSSPAPMDAGVVKGSCRIPGDLLNDETYLVRLLVVDQGRALCDLQDVMAFKVHEGERDGAWHGKWVGTVRPKLEWQVESETG